VTSLEPTWIGVDPGGERCFGIAILRADSSCHTFCVNHVDAALNVILEQIRSTPAGIGVDAPLWWSSGPAGLRKADKRIRDQYHLPNRNVQAVNSLWGAVLAQGMMFVARMREAFPTVNVTETHPKAVLVGLGTSAWKELFATLVTGVTLETQPDHERDAVISAIAAREGFEGRWTRDLIQNRYPSEQNPMKHWLAPVHYYWPA
jgi:predicted nuclease with RNAse H fold